MLMGFKPCMGMDTIVIATKLNYGRLGLGFDNGHQLVPLMCFGLRCSPKLRAWLTMDLSFHFGLRTVVVSALHCEGRNSLGNEGKLHLDFMSAIHFCFVAPFVTLLLIQVSLGCLHVPRDGEEEHGSSSAFGFECGAKV